jgi:hypothetical protein
MFNTATESAKIRKALKAQGFEIFNGEYGFKVRTVKGDNHPLMVYNRHYGETNEVAPILAELGYEVQVFSPFTTVIYGKAVN